MLSVSKYYYTVIDRIKLNTFIQLSIGYQHLYGSKLKNILNKFVEYIYPEALASIYRKVYLYVHVLPAYDECEKRVMDYNLLSLNNLHT